MMRPAAELHRVLPRLHSGRARAICRIVKEPSSPSGPRPRSLPLLPFDTLASTRNECAAGSTAISWIECHHRRPDASRGLVRRSMSTAGPIATRLELIAICSTQAAPRHIVLCVEPFGVIVRIPNRGGPLRILPRSEIASMQERSELELEGSVSLVVFEA
ncbi:hypothetical protein KM043_014297 [Ampulex compressa]|nr:hypothetical protein KM043_014297 [Ampulex compressa]